ncbi:HAD family hydrolase [Larsenimonas salina]|uniref:HAD family hydrolase n=1 Tax=Larsenimonas salina TaxID=1295565 RepID=UPI0020743134|nr:HAD family hydrolase [Larsenimonas salina]MCM5705240.1 HAD family hydrolase [Larsenimonas salina]
MIKALTFDLDDTLWDNGPVMVRTEQGHYDWLNQQAGHAERFPPETYLERRLAAADRYPLRRGDFTFLRRTALFEILSEHGLDNAEANRLADEAIDYMLTLRHEVTLFEESLPLLNDLKQHYGLAAITNGNVDIHRILETPLFDCVINAGEWLAPKPDARTFLAAMARLGTAPSETIHVGDSWTEDALPALRLGMHVAWIDRKETGPAFSHPRLHTMTHVRELPDVIERITAARA